VTIGWLAFVVVEVGSLLWTNFQPFRNLVPVVPFIGIAAAAGSLALARFAVGRLSRPPVGTRALAGGIVAALCITMVLWGVDPALRQRSDIVDSRVEAIENLEGRLDESSRTLIGEELAFLPAELRRLRGEVVVVDRDRARDLDVRQFDYVVTGPLRGGSVAGADPPRDWELAGEFGWVIASPAPELGRGNRERILIFHP
jgi:hypothetical protein